MRAARVQRPRSTPNGSRRPGITTAAALTGSGSANSRRDGEAFVCADIVGDDGLPNHERIPDERAFARRAGWRLGDRVGGPTVRSAPAQLLAARLELLNRAQLHLQHLGNHRHRVVQERLEVVGVKRAKAELSQQRLFASSGFEARLRPPALADVPVDSQVAGHVAEFVLHGDCDELYFDRDIVLASGRDLDPRSARLQQLPLQREPRRVAGIARDFARRTPEHLLRREAVESLGALAPGGDAEILRVGRDQSILDVVQ